MQLTAHTIRLHAFYAAAAWHASPSQGSFCRLSQQQPRSAHATPAHVPTRCPAHELYAPNRCLPISRRITPCTRHRPPAHLPRGRSLQPPPTKRSAARGGSAPPYPLLPLSSLLLLPVRPCARVGSSPQPGALLPPTAPPCPPPPCPPLRPTPSAPQCTMPSTRSSLALTSATMNHATVEAR